MAKNPLQGRVVAPEEWTWHEDKDPPYHRKIYSTALTNFYDQIFGGGKKRVFLPLCGKTLDMICFADKGHEVVGLEFSKTAIKSFFKENNLTYTETKIENEPFVTYQAKEKDITIFQGDLFKLKPGICGQFDGCWDRGSYVAINVPTREAYVELMTAIMKPGGQTLMESMEYDPSLWPGPPHYTTEENVRSHFGENFDLEILDVYKKEPPSYVKVDMQFTYRIWHLTRK